MVWLLISGYGVIRDAREAIFAAFVLVSQIIYCYLWHYCFLGAEEIDANARIARTDSRCSLRYSSNSYSSQPSSRRASKSANLIAALIATALRHTPNCAIDLSRRS